jgi:eukaryotic-like serine/threonine-protein kinase
MKPLTVYEFGPFCLDPAERSLTRDGIPVSLTPKAFETLLVLVERSGHLVEKDELMCQVWPDAFVEEVGLARNVSSLRKALGEGPTEIRYIETVPKRGYRFVAPVRTLGESDSDLVFRRQIRAQIIREEEEDEPSASEARTVKPQTSQSAASNAKSQNLPAAVDHYAVLSRAPGTETNVRGSRSYQATTTLIFSGLLMIVTVVCYGLYRLASHQRASVSFQSAKLARLTSTGTAIGAAISPDGKWLVYVADDGAQQSLWLRQVAITNSNTQIVPSAEVQYGGVAFSPDGNYIYYSVQEKNDFRGTLYLVPVLGGTARKLLTGIHSSVAFSPDSKRMAFFYFYEDEDRLMIANADGTGVRQLATRRGSEVFFFGWFSGASWSPDGKTLATPLGNTAENYMTVAAVSVESGDIKSLTPQKWDEVRQVAWLSDGSRLLVTAKEQATANFNIWEISSSSGEAKKITNDLNSYTTISLAADSNTLATIQTERMANLWVMPPKDSAHATQITQGRGFDSQPSWTPDGKIVYTSNASGSNNLYLIDPRGANSKQLSFGSGLSRSPSVSPDGRHIVFLSDRSGVQHLWRMESDGGNPKQLTDTDRPDFDPYCSPDGQWVVYASAANKATLWKVALNGGQPLQLTEKSSYSPAISPDGKQITCYYKEEPTAPFKIAILPSEGGQPIKTFTLSTTGFPDTNLRWTPDGRAIVYAVTRGGVSNLWAQPVDGSQPKQLTSFTSDRIFRFDFSRDGKQIALSRGSQASDVVLLVVTK